MGLEHFTTERGPRILITGTYGIPYYRNADFPEPIAVTELTPAQRGCLATELAAWLSEAAEAARAIHEELLAAQELQHV